MADKSTRSKAVAKAGFPALVAEVKVRIQTAQARAIFAVNAELVRLYWDVGRIVRGRQANEGWGAGVIPRLSRELHNELPDLKGFSERNIKLMVQFSSEYPGAFAAGDPIGQPAVAQLPRVEFRRIPSNSLRNPAIQSGSDEPPKAGPFCPNLAHSVSIAGNR